MHSLRSCLSSRIKRKGLEHSVPKTVGERKACILLQLGLLVRQVAGPVCSELKKLQDTGLEEGNLQAAPEPPQWGRMAGGSLRTRYPGQGPGWLPLLRRVTLGTSLGSQCPQLLFWVAPQWLKLSRAPVVTSSVSEAAIYLFTSVCTVRLHLYVYPGVL